MAKLNEILGKLEKLLPSKTLIEENIKNAELPISALICHSYELLKSSENVSDVHKIIDIILDKTWEDLNTGHWSSVPLFRRFIYSVASFMMILAKVKQSLSVPFENRKIYLEEALKSADRGLLLGGELRSELTTAAEVLSLEIAKYNDFKKFSSNLITSSSVPYIPGINGEPVPILDCPSLETFYSQHFNTRKPVKLKECINHWPAITKWQNIDYLIEKAGERTVPVELGSKYDDSEWSQKLMNFREFVEKHVLIQENESEKGYLAQHQLFLQIPELKNDIREPEFCCCSDFNEETENDVDINAWFGPAGTISPLHFDPKHNLLAQVVGKKRVILYDPRYSDRLYPHDSKLLVNTAQTDPENPDYKRFPSFKDTPALETILNPGEILYIPPTWWHHVRSLDISFSVSFWW